MPNPYDFAAAVARLERQLGHLPDETQISEALHWTHSRTALIALAQEARATGLVRIFYDADNGTRRYACT